MNKNAKAAIICIIMAMSVGCNNTNSSSVNEVKENKSNRSSAIMKNGNLNYKNISTLYKEINEGLVPNTEVFSNLILEEITNGLATFQKPLGGNSYQTLQFVITPELQKQLDDDGIYYHTEGQILHPEYLSTMSIEGIEYVKVYDLNTAEEFTKTRAQIIKDNPAHYTPTSEIGVANFITKIVDINKVEHSLTKEDLEIKTYDTIEEIDEAIRTGEIGSGGIFTMSGYKILDQNTILTTDSYTNQAIELCITPYIAEQLKASDEIFRVEYTEINGKTYIIGLSTIK